MRSMVETRRASVADAESVASVLEAAFREFEPLYTRDAFRATTPAAEQVRRRLDEGPVWVAEQHGMIVGTVSAIAAGDGLYVRSMAVHPVARGKGVGTHLLAAAEGFATAHHYRRLVLSTTPFLAAAIRLYEQAGFRRTDEGPHDLFGTPLTTMVKELATA